LFGLTTLVCISKLKNVGKERRASVDTPPCRDSARLFLIKSVQEISMKTAFRSVALGLLVSAGALPSMASDNRIEFEGGIGSTPFASPLLVPANGGPLLANNDVRGIAPGGRPWVIGKLRASIRADGQISVKGEGLLLGGGNNVGLPAIPRQVVATLLCGTGADLAQYNSPAVDLDARGNFSIKGTLASVQLNTCVTPALLIRNFANGAAGAWFAAGIPEN
jgi:hypothetical protein